MYDRSCHNTLRPKKQENPRGKKTSRVTGSSAAKTRKSVLPDPTKALPLLGLARRAGKLVLGMDAAIESIKDREAFLLILASDLAPRSLRNIQAAAEACKTEISYLPYTMDEICAALGKRSGIIAVCDEGFAGRLQDLLALPKKKPGRAPMQE